MSGAWRPATLLAAGLLAVFSVVSVFPSWAADGPPGAPDGALTAVAAFQEALVAGDRDAALALLDPGVVIFESGGAEMSRNEYADHHLAADLEFVAATNTEIVDRRSGGSEGSAWVLTRSKTSGSFRGKRVDTTGTETMILVPGAEGKWVIVHIHWSS